MPNIDGALTKSLYEHVKMLYRYTEPRGLEIYVCTLPEELPIYENVNKVYLIGESIELNVLENFLTKYPNLDTLMIRPKIIGELSDTSKILEIGNIHLSNPGKFGASLLSKFTGRNIDSRQFVITEAELNEFVRKWMNNEAYQNLKLADFDTTLDCVLNSDLVFDQLETERFDSSKRPQSYEFEIKLFNISTPSVDFSGDDCFDVIRNIDGKRASVLCKFLEFKFLVWD